MISDGKSYLIVRPADEWSLLEELYIRCGDAFMELMMREESRSD